ncbi:MAG: hypothetical protein ACREMD_05025 [Gemmatimonadota bacterium]
MKAQTQNTDIEILPLVDRHGFRTTARPEQVWAALAPTLMASFGKRRSRVFARLVGCRERRVSRPFLMEGGDTLVGFRVMASRAPEELVLRGEHRFSRYALVFRIGGREGITAVSAETRADFPEARGFVYRTLVVGSGIHARVIRRILKGLRGRAEWDRQPSGPRRAAGAGARRRIDSK